MSRVLFLAYHFPPIGGAGVQRSLKFAEHLPDFGWEPIVITVPGATGGRWTPTDRSLSAQLPPGLQVVRLSTSEPPASTGWQRRGERWLRIQPRFSDWWVDGATQAAASVAEVDDSVEVVYASMSPFESAEAAAAIARRLDRPWVADLRDPWALDEMQVYPTALHRMLETRRMGRLLAGADAIVMNTNDAAAAVLERFPALRTKPVVVIPNGFDARDFAAPEQQRTDSAFRIVHSGYLHTELGRAERRRVGLRRVLGGSARNVDILTRSHVYLLDALRRLRARRPDLASRLQLHLAGIVSEADRDALQNDEWVVVHGYVPHEESVELVRSADMLFLPMHDLPTGRRARIVPGKTYEYLASGRPILAAVPDGDARDMLAMQANASLCRPGDVEAMERAVERGMDELDTTGRASSQPISELLARYERRELTHRLADVFDGLSSVAPRPSLDPKVSLSAGR